MGRYVDKDNWEEEILIPDTNTPILGGQPVWEGDRLVDGFANVSAAVLADRTRHLKNKVDGIEIGLDTNFDNFMKKEDNLSDLEDIQQAKYNLELNLVDNTRDLAKPISDTTQEALDDKVDLTDPRLTDSRTPKGSAGGVLSGSYPNPTFSVDMATQAELDAVAAAKVDKVAGKGLSDENYTLAEKNKLGGVEGGATANATDAQLRDRTTHTGVQAIDTVSGLQAKLDSKSDTTYVNAQFAEKVDKVAGKDLSDENYTLDEKNKLGGVEDGATKNSTDVQLRDRATHTGEQPISSVTNLQDSLDSKVDKQSGYGLTQENYTPAEKSKLSSIEGSKFKGEYVSLAALVAAQPSPEVGSYAYVDAGVGEVVSKYIWDSSDAEWVKQQGETASLTPAEIKSLYEGNPDTNAFSDSEKAKLAGVQAGAQVNSVTTVNGKTGAVVVTGTDVGLGNANNTSDANKPVSTAQQAALNLKADKSSLGTAASRDVGESSGQVMEVGAFGLGSNTADVQASVGYSNPTGFYYNAGEPGGAFFLDVRYSDTTGAFRLSNTPYTNSFYLAGYGQSGAPALSPVEVYHTGNMPTTATRWPTFAEVTDKPTNYATTWESVASKPAQATRWPSWGEVTSKPSVATKTQVLNANGTNYVTGSSYADAISWSTATWSSGTGTLNLNTSLNHILNINGSVNVGLPSNATLGKTGDIVLRVNSSGNTVVVGWSTQWKFLGKIPDIGANGEVWVVSYKVLSSTEILASAAKVA